MIGQRSPSKWLTNGLFFEGGGGFVATYIQWVRKPQCFLQGNGAPQKKAKTPMEDLVGSEMHTSLPKEIKAL